MSELTYSAPTLKTLEEIEQAIEHYKTSDISGAELLNQWEAIRDASLNQNFADPIENNAGDSDKDIIPGQDSY